MYGTKTRVAAFVQELCRNASSATAPPPLMRNRPRMPSDAILVRWSNEPDLEVSSATAFLYNKRTDKQSRHERSTKLGNVTLTTKQTFRLSHVKSYRLTSLC